jgi:putative addiction module component (TIGR02574 family)
MTQAAKNVLRAALTLSAEDRAELLRELTADQEIAPDDLPFDPAWLDEADRRLAEMDAGLSQGVPWEEVQRRARERRPGVA